MADNEKLVQAGIRLVVVFLTAGISAVGANATILKDAISDPVLATLSFSVITAVISAILKYLGGATAQPAAPVAEDPDHPAPRGAGKHRAAEAKRPNPLAL